MALLRSKRAMLCKHMKIDSANLRWYAAFHNEGHHPHVHLMVCLLYTSQMLHAGNPIGYADINSAYWTEHFYAVGRLPAG